MTPKLVDLPKPAVRIGILGPFNGSLLDFVYALDQTLATAGVDYHIESAEASDFPQLDILIPQSQQSNAESAIRTVGQLASDL